jgi:hypothetical protein
MGILFRVQNAKRVVVGSVSLVTPDPLLDRPVLRRRLLGPGVQAESLARVGRPGLRCGEGVRGVQWLLSEAWEGGGQDSEAVSRYENG